MSFVDLQHDWLLAGGQARRWASAMLAERGWCLGAQGLLMALQYVFTECEWDASAGLNVGIFSVPF